MCGAPTITFSVSRKYMPRVWPIWSQWGKEGSASREACAAFIDRANAQALFGFVYPRLNDPSIDMVKLYKDGKMSKKDAIEILTRWEEHEEQIKALRRAITMDEEVEESKRRAARKVGTN